MTGPLMFSAGILPVGCGLGQLWKPGTTASGRGIGAALDAHNRMHA